MAVSSPPLLPQEYLPQLMFPGGPSAPVPQTKQDNASLIADILQLCNVDWVRAYLFTPDPIQVHTLNSPDFTASALTGSLVISRFLSDPHSSAPPILFQHIVDNLVFVQDFSAAGVIVGHGIKESCVEKGSSWLPKQISCSSSSSSITPNTSFSSTASLPPKPQSHFNIRFAISPTDNTSIFVYDAPEHDSILLRGVHYQTTSLVKMYKLVLSRTKFLSMMRTTTFLHIESVLPLVLSLQHEWQWRACGTCDLNPEQAKLYCRCQPGTPLPRHPRDVASFAKVMATHLGDYTGVAHLGSQQLISCMKMHGVADLDLTKRLRDWALRGYVTQTFNPRQMELNPIQEVASPENFLGLGRGATHPAKTDTYEELVQVFNALQQEEEMIENEVVMVDGTGDEDKKKAATMERRREKNRVSARKCNERKREHRLWLEREVRLINEKASQLRKRELALLQENRQLHLQLKPGLKLT